MSISFWPTIQQLAGGPFGSPAAIARDSQWTIVMVDTSGSGGADQYAKLPSGCGVGDLVEVHWFNSTTQQPQIMPPSGEPFNSGAAVVAGARFFRKIGTALWGVLD